MIPNIYAEIANERLAQDKKWGGPDHDDGHTSHDWIAYLTKHIGLATLPTGFRGSYKTSTLTRNCRGFIT